MSNQSSTNEFQESHPLGSHKHMVKHHPNPKKNTKAFSTTDVIKTIVRVPKKATEASSNWKQLVPTVQKDIIRTRRSRRRGKSQVVDVGSDKEGKAHQNDTKHLSSSKASTSSNVVLNEFRFPAYDASGKCMTQGMLPIKYAKNTWCLAMDCEMVGVGPMKESALARVSIVNEMGFCLYDKFVKPKVDITDYRTHVSGIREEDMAKAHDFNTVIREVAGILKGHVLVGHALENDLNALFLRHPRHRIRDTSRYLKVGHRRPGLKMLTEKHLNVKIQTGEHNSIQDAQAAMKLYLLHRKEWEDSVKHNQHWNRHQ